MTVAKQVRRGPLPGASARNIGRSSPPGATVVEGGVNFSFFSRNAAGVELLFFDREDDPTPSRAVRIDPATNRTYHYWHVFLPGMAPGQIYAYRVEGPSAPARGLRFDPAKVLLDPYGRGVVIPENYDREAARREGDNAASAMKSVVVEPGAYDWGGDLPLGRPSSRTIIYEMHVRGFTRHPSSGVGEQTRGTFAGLIEKIPYLRELGVTAVELLPVFAFDAHLEGDAMSCRLAEGVPDLGEDNRRGNPDVIDHPLFGGIEEEQRVASATTAGILAPRAGPRVSMTGIGRVWMPAKRHRSTDGALRPTPSTAPFRLETCAIKAIESKHSWERPR